MTNAELLAKIKAEIERIRKSYDVYLARITKEDVFNDLDDFLYFLDTLEEEPVSDDLEEAAVDIADVLLAKPKDYALAAKADYWNGAHDGVIAGAKWQAEKDTRDMCMSDNRHFEKVYQLGRTDMREQMLKELSEKIAAAYQLGIKDKEQKSVEGLDEVAKAYALDTAEDSEQYSARYLGYKDGAKWQKQHDAELIEIAYNDGITIGMTKQKEQDDKELSDLLTIAHLQGADQMKEQMMKEAEPAEIGYFNQRGLSILTDKSIEKMPVSEGDKVRIIIIKDDGKSD